MNSTHAFGQSYTFLGLDFVKTATYSAGRRGLLARFYLPAICLWRIYNVAKFHPKIRRRRRISMIHYLMYIDTHGDISQIRIAKGVNPTDRAVDPEVGQYCVHYMEALSDIGAFHASKVWNYTTEQWDTRALRPNYHAVWENGAWTWNVHTLLQDIRVERNNRLALCDWTIANDSPLSDSQKNRGYHL